MTRGRPRRCGQPPPERPRSHRVFVRLSMTPSRSTATSACRREARCACSGAGRAGVEAIGYRERTGPRRHESRANDSNDPQPCRLPINTAAPRVNRRTWLWTVTAMWTTAPALSRSRASGRRLPTTPWTAASHSPPRADWRARPHRPQLRHQPQAFGLPEFGGEIGTACLTIKSRYALIKM
jgi:hypothetical protein